ncbi:hypothetical protein O181_046997 [Austropuccinia psidii MF-1]|uniref:Uncharacterized protein n=1 Tax=Austropuccinia psidii MF-1 TaxID=1389203 RepID=A0A9Q3HK81_9BASI|nr:hypothetical protein [Austropuccinia psidii MF-1]
MSDLNRARALQTTTIDRPASSSLVHQEHPKPANKRLLNQSLQTSKMVHQDQKVITFLPIQIPPSIDIKPLSRQSISNLHLHSITKLSSSPVSPNLANSFIIPSHITHQPTIKKFKSAPILSSRLREKFLKMVQASPGNNSFKLELPPHPYQQRDNNPQLASPNGFIPAQSCSQLPRRKKRTSSS